MINLANYLMEEHYLHVRTDSKKYHLLIKALLRAIKVVKQFSCSTQLSIEFILLINVKIPAIVGSITFTSRSRIDTTSENF